MRNGVAKWTLSLGLTVQRLSPRCPALHKYSLLIILAMDVLEEITGDTHICCFKQQSTRVVEWFQIMASQLCSKNQNKPNYSFDIQYNDLAVTFRNFVLHEHRHDFMSCLPMLVFWGMLFVILLEGFICRVTFSCGGQGDRNESPSLNADSRANCEYVSGVQKAWKRPLYFTQQIQKNQNVSVITMPNINNKNRARNQIHVHIYSVMMSAPLTKPTPPHPTPPCHQVCRACPLLQTLTTHCLSWTLVERPFIYLADNLGISTVIKLLIFQDCLLLCFLFVCVFVLFCFPQMWGVLCCNVVRICAN